MPQILTKRQKNKISNPIDLALCAGFYAFELAPWRCQVIVYHVDDFPILADAFPDADDMRPCGASFQTLDVDGYRLALIGVLVDESPAVTAGRVAHEALHCLNAVYRHAGQQWDLDNDEHEAYSLQHLVYHAMIAVERMGNRGA